MGESLRSGMMIDCPSTTSREIDMTLLRNACVILMVAGLAACATPGPQPGEMEIRRGVIEQINATEIANNHNQGVGAVVGGLAGLGIGSLIGGGTGRDVAMVLGTVGGAIVGNEIQKKHDRPIAAQQIIVRTSNGVLVSVTQPPNPNLRVG